MLIKHRLAHWFQTLRQALRDDSVSDPALRDPARRESPDISGQGDNPCFDRAGGGFYNGGRLIYSADGNNFTKVYGQVSNLPQRIMIRIARALTPDWNKRNVIIFMATFIAAISITEWIFAYRSVGYGILLSLFLSLIVYLIAVLGKLPSPYLECAESMVLIPLYILFTSSLPWFFLRQELLLPAVYAVILALCFWHIYDKDISLKSLGFIGRKWAKYALIGALIGAPLGTIEYFVLKIPPAYPNFQILVLLRDLVYMLFFVGLGEELLFRAIIQVDLTRAFGWKWGLFLASFLFMVMHLTWRSVPELFFVFSAAVILGFMWNKTGSIVGITVLHGVGNTFLVGVWPYIFR
ncbi:MAG: type II CAAX endopeptidase family protein [Dehalococcoidia bacterium]|nr:type II CAAX endopeptidase family protein [Dehalococcoidia bacterium]